MLPTIRHRAYDKVQSVRCWRRCRASRSSDLQSELRGRVRSTRGELGHHDHLPMSEGCHERSSLLNLMLRPHLVIQRRGIKGARLSLTKRPRHQPPSSLPTTNIPWVPASAATITRTSTSSVVRTTMATMPVAGNGDVVFPISAGHTRQNRRTRPLLAVRLLRITRVLKPVTRHAGSGTGGGRFDSPRADSTVILFISGQYYDQRPPAGSRVAEV